ncbi:uncharacterized protein LOC135226681 [Macrobrachium nipponense]|uniref:uncharacterized protein LOC135226681 n=1 Tax=Macrobrachium nipponense TaxID=159736 RepID=UPI0030C8352A
MIIGKAAVQLWGNIQASPEPESDGRDGENGIIVSRAFSLCLPYSAHQKQVLAKLIQFASIESALLNSSPSVAAMETHTTTCAYSTLRRGAAILSLLFDAMANATSVDNSNGRNSSKNNT